MFDYVVQLLECAVEGVYKVLQHPVVSISSGKDQPIVHLGTKCQPVCLTNYLVSYQKCRLLNVLSL